MACDRCGEPRASDGVNLGGSFTSPNGRKLFIVVRMLGSIDQAGKMSASFCFDCWTTFLKQLAAASAETLKPHGAPPA